MNIIDAHMHFSDIASFKQTAAGDSAVDYSYDGYMDESSRCGIAKSVCMGLTETTPFGFPDAEAETPMLGDLDARVPDKMYVCPGVNPYKLDKNNISALEDMLRLDKKTAGIKIYAGYYHKYVYDAVYDPVYELARDYGVPVAIHSGDTYSDRGLLIYSHPLAVDRLAVKHRGVKFVICHIGAPWITDACELAYKNNNVYMDMSGLYIGGAARLEGFSSRKRVMEHFIGTLEAFDVYEKLMFGTDWPLAPMGAYLKFCERLVPEDVYDDVFHKTAAGVFTRVNG